MFWYILAFHFLGDFVFQSHKMASNKSKYYNALAQHVLVYTLVLTVGFITSNIPTDFKDPGPGAAVVLFVLITAGTHALTDAVTSRISGKLFQGAIDDYREHGFEGKAFGAYLHDFFVVIGFDQLIHAVTLYWTLKTLHAAL